MPHDTLPPENPGPRRSLARTAVAVLCFLAQWFAWLVRNPVAWTTAVSRTIVIVRQGGVASVWGAVLYKAAARQSGTDAPAWYARYRRNAARRDRAPSEWPADAPLLRVVVPLASFDERGCDRLVRSMLAQGYPHWELWCLASGGAAGGAKRYATNFATYDPRIRVATPDEALLTLGNDTRNERELYVLLAERVAEFEPAAFGSLAHGVAFSHADLVYGDHLVVDERSSSLREVAALPGYSYELFLTSGYFAGGAAIRAAILHELQPAVLRAALGNDSFELLLHVIERSFRVTHVPAIIARWRHCAGDVAARAVAVEEHVTRIGHAATVQVIEKFGTLDIQAEGSPHAPASRVAIVVPTRNAYDLLRQCVESLEATGALERSDLWIVDHRTEQPQAVAYLDSLARRHHVLRATGAFNFSRLVNQGVTAAGHSYSHYLLLNNDIEATESGWLDHLLATAQRPGVGAVGATLLYPDGAIQHAGVVLGMRGLAGHYELGTTFRDAAGARRLGPHKTLVATRETSAVTAACVLVSREAWQTVAGFDESIAVGYGDVDFCLRLQMAGFRILHDPHAVLIHHESRTRGRAVWDPHPADTRRFLRQYRASILARDPYYSPLLSNVLTQCQLGSTRPGTPRTSTRTIPCPVSTRIGISGWRKTATTPATRLAA